jgi:hypothetical protein
VLWFKGLWFEIYNPFVVRIRAHFGSDILCLYLFGLQWWTSIIIRPVLLRSLCVLQGIQILNYLIAILPAAYGQCCATTPSFGSFDHLDGPYRICTVQDGARTIYLKSTVPTVQGRLHRTVWFWCNFAVWLQFRPITFPFFLQQLLMKKRKLLTKN